MELFPNNKVEEFKVQLPKTIELDGQWEVGLAEIQYPHSWYNIQENEFLLTINGSESILLQQGYYKDVDEICQHLNASIKRKLTMKNVHFEFNKLNQKVALYISSVNGENNVVNLSPSLAELLGMKKLLGGDYHTYHETVKGEYVSDAHQGLYALYVYCDLVTPHIVGDVSVPLLRAVPVEEGFVISKQYENIHYYPVLRNKFNTVDINIKDDMNQNVKFQFGKSIVTLHFRQTSIKRQ